MNRAIPVENQEAIMRVMDNIKIIRGTYDIKTTMIGGEEIRFKAEVDIDGRELTKRYLETLSLDDLLQVSIFINSQLNITFERVCTSIGFRMF